MTNEQFLKKLGVKESRFRLWAVCLGCVCWRKDEQGRWHCTEKESEDVCRRKFEAWLKEDTDAWLREDTEA